MAMEAVSAAGGNIEVMLLQQVGSDPFTPTLERAAQIGEVARRIARFINEARATLDIAIYDFRLRDDAAEIMTDALRSEQRIMSSSASSMMRPLGDDTVSTASPANLEADRKPPGTESFVRSFSDIAQIKGITGYRALMHNKYIVRDCGPVLARVVLQYYSLCQRLNSRISGTSGLAPPPAQITSGDDDEQRTARRNPRAKAPVRRFLQGRRSGCRLSAL